MLKWCAGLLGAAALNIMTLVPASAVPVSVGPASGTCVSVSCDLAFSLPGDFEVLVLEAFGSMGAFNTTLEFSFASGGSDVFNFNTVNQPSDFSALTFEWFADGASFALLDGTASAVSSLTFGMVSGVLYTLEIAGNVISTPAQYDVSLRPVPVPPALLLFASALGGLGFLSRRRKARAA